MNWRIEFAPEVELDVAEAAEWYEIRQPGLGARFIEEIIQVWDVLADNRRLNSRRHPLNLETAVGMDRELREPR
jgi:hypothetical protein